MGAYSASLRQVGMNNVASWVGIRAWVLATCFPCGALAQLTVVSPSASYTLLPTDTAPAPYQAILGSGSFVSTSVDALNPLHFLGLGYLFLEQPAGPQAAPPFPIKNAAIYKAGVQMTSAPVLYGTPEWRTLESSVPGVPTTILLVPFSISCNYPFQPSVLTPGDYRLNLTDGTNALAFVAFSLASAPPLPTIKVASVGDFCVVSWPNNPATGWVTLQDSADLRNWRTLGIFPVSGASVTNAVNSSLRFYRLRQNF